MTRFLNLAKGGVFRTIQGEGVLSGLPMVFIRLAGCDVNCVECDTDYAFHRKASIAEIFSEVQSHQTGGWVWITGGEPTMSDIRPLTVVLKDAKYKVAMATSGKRKIGIGGWNGWNGWADHIYVSPHSPLGPEQDMGNELNVVPGLNGLSLDDVSKWDTNGFPHKWVTPCSGKKKSLDDCVEFVMNNPGWRLGCQSHKVWGVS